MRWLIVSLAAAAVVLPLSFLGRPSAADSPAKKPVGIDKRVPWTTSHVKGSPEPPAPYRSEVAFPKLTFAEPLDLTYVPGARRLAVAERRGKIFTFVNDPKTAKADQLLNIKQADQIYAITFHPDFARNGYLFVTYVIGDGKANGTRLSRFQVKGDPPVADPASERILFWWPSGGHNAGCLKFGPDGFLYVGTGDGSGIADEYQTGQDLSDVRGKILRLDVSDPRFYGIPKDNPFVDRGTARPEIWAYGLRQPWKMSFDRVGGDFWVGEVGQDLWESVHLIKKGGNYGWSVKEGTHDFRPERPKGPDPILPPVFEHSHSEFRSLTGGYVYRGTRLKDLVGSYVYGDFDTGRVWRLRVLDKGTGKVQGEELAQTALRIVSFGEDEEGDLFFLDFAGGKVHRLVAAEKGPDAPPFPRKLSETGLFESTKDLKPAPGLIPYTVNAQLWSDGATKERYLALPGNSQIDFDAVIYPYGDIHPGHPRGWRFPNGTVAVKTFFLDLDPSAPDKGRRRLETRLLHFETRPGTEEYGDGYWRGYTYEWNDEQTDAVLVDRAGKDRTFTIKEKGGGRKQTWHFPSRSECTGCHTMPAKYVLGLNTLQMNRDHDYGGGRVANQLRTLEHLGVFKAPLPKPPEELPKLADYQDRKQPVDARARAYLHANCAHCHMKWGGGNAEFELLATMDLKSTKVLSDPPRQGKFGLTDPGLVVPGSPERSMVLWRMKQLDAPRMPRIASSVVDQEGVRLVEEWIKEMK
jgi:uncharacterized repeat protein (TIGR03806 family)